MPNETPSEGIARVAREEFLDRHGIPGDAATEHRRRIYYQDIVYAVCNELDRAFDHWHSRGEGVVCGTADEPRKGVQEAMKQIVDEYRILKHV